MSSRVRVLSIIDDLGFGGDENRLLSFAATIDRERFEHRVVTIQRPHSSRAESWAMHRHYHAAGIRVSSLDEMPGAQEAASRGALHVVGAARRLVRKVRKVRRVVRDWRADVIDAHLESAGLVSVLAAAASRTPTAVTLYSPVPLAPPRFWRLPGHLITSMASVIVTDSEARRHDIIRRMSRVRRPVLVVPNGIAPPRAARTADEIRGQLGLPHDPGGRVIGQVAALARHKGHLDLLEAARSVLARAPATMFLLVGFCKGDIAYRERIERAIRDQGLADRVRLVSYPGPIGDVWQLIDLQVHAATYDSLPNALIEGMSLAKPIVATTVGGVPDMLKHQESAWLVPPHDPGALANALLRLLEDPALAARLAAAAQHCHLARYQPAIMTRALEGCFAELAS